MQPIESAFKYLNDEVLKAYGNIGINDLKTKLIELQSKQQDPNFWQDNLKAASINKEISKLVSRIEPWESLLGEVQLNYELSKTKDSSLEQDLQDHLEQLTKQYELLKKELLFSQNYDNYDAIVSIFAGAGGTDAQDWAEMLLRMYLRFVENNKNLSTLIIDQSKGDEAGIKSVSFIVSGPLAYGNLKSEHGVHRLVRLSPFNADNLRQTSFARVEVVPKIDAPDEVIIDESDLKIDVYRAGGHGGQSVNTTDSAVRITHTPTGIVVAIQNERSQLQNKETALTILRSKLMQLKLEQHKDSINDIKGPSEQAAWGNQIRNYVMHPYSMVKDLRTRYETSDVTAVLNGDINSFITAYLEKIAVEQS